MIEASRPRAERRRLGAFYTAEPVAYTLVQWALDGKAGPVLDPSFGGCSFLRAALKALHELGTPAAGRFVYGFDIDHKVNGYGNELIPLGVPADNVVIGDFFKQTPMGGRLPTFRAVVGNPPYVRHHWFQRGARKAARDAIRDLSLEVPQSASTWAYFLIHAAQFLGKGGRLAMLLPDAVLHADYARPVVQYLSSKFESVRMLKVASRLFADAQEGTVILLASGYGGVARQVAFEEVADETDLDAAVTSPSNGSNFIPSCDFGWKQVVLRESTWALWDSLKRDPRVYPLGVIAQIRIGVVTGANSFFIRSASEIVELEGQFADVVPIISRGNLLRSLAWSADDQRGVEGSGMPTRLLLLSRGATNRRELNLLIRRGRHDQIHERQKCKTRAVWFAIEDKAVPDAFLRYMGSAAPTIVLNEARVTCTNAVHRLTWKQPGICDAAAAVGSCTSIFALGAELYGRAYGGGVLKIEPGPAASIPVPVVPEAGKWVGELDRLMRQGLQEKARELADKLVLKDGLGLHAAQVTALARATEDLAMRRRRRGQ